MRLNPEKCAFEVWGGKFLLCVVSQKVIETNPEKIKATLNKAPSKNIKKMHELSRKMATLNRFVSRSADK